MSTVRSLSGGKQTWRGHRETEANLLQLRGLLGVDHPSQSPRMRSAVRFSLLVFGAIAILIGLVWVGQGTGYFPYPSSSFMIDQMPWAYYGIVLAVLGLIAVAVSRRM
jgi:hypothetical protein